MNAARTLSIFPRVGLAAGRDCGQPLHATLLLEGAWPQGDALDAESLDEQFDARDAWIDDEAARLAEELGQRGLAAGRQGWLPWLDNLKLRYLLVRLIRVVAWFDAARRDGRAFSHVTLHLAGPRDEDYALVVQQIARVHGFALTTASHGVEALPAPPALPANPPHRRLVSKLAGLWGGWRSRREDSSGPRVLFCGNPSLLDPVCAGLLGQGVQVAWLWDRFPVQWFRRWQGRVAPLVCDALLGHECRLAVDCGGPLVCRHVDLAPAVRSWLGQRAAHYGAWQTRLVERIDDHCRAFRPDVLVLDEDSTPTARAAVAIVRQRGAASLVLQHGAPYVRFGYAPLAADRIAVWGESSRQRFLSWGVADERIRVAGSPKHDAMFRAPCAPRSLDGRRPRVLILGTLPPADDRPDSVALHFTSASHRGMLRAALDGIARAAPDALVTLKLHPRLASEAVFRDVLAATPDLPVEFVISGDLAQQIADCDLVLSCLSSAGVEAAACRRPVIELVPLGGQEPLSAEAWGLFGAARTATDVADLMRRILAGETAPDRREETFANFRSSAVAAICDEVRSLAALPARVS